MLRLKQNCHDILLVRSCLGCRASLTFISKVPDQNGVFLLYIMLEIHHSGREPLFWKYRLKTSARRKAQRTDAQCTSNVQPRPDKVYKGKVGMRQLRAAGRPPGRYLKQTSSVLFIKKNKKQKQTPLTELDSTRSAELKHQQHKFTLMERTSHIPDASMFDSILRMVSVLRSYGKDSSLSIEATTVRAANFFSLSLHVYLTGCLWSQARRGRPKMQQLCGPPLWNRFSSAIFFFPFSNSRWCGENNSKQN